MKLLLISNSTNYGEEYLAWPRQYIQDFLRKNNVKKVLFVPYAGVGLAEGKIEESYDIYENRVQSVFSELGADIYSVHKEKNPVAAVENAEAIAVGGGNTFHLVYMMHKTGIMDAIRKKALEGTPFMGWSAGSNVACPTLKTTNDMPIIEPASFHCLNLIPFQINPHYLDTNPEGHGGETREQRIEEYLVVNKEMTVVGLREACLLEIEGKEISLKGSRNLRVFNFGKEPEEYAPGSDILFLFPEIS